MTNGGSSLNLTQRARPSWLFVEFGKARSTAALLTVVAVLLATLSLTCCVGAATTSTPSSPGPGTPSTSTSAGTLAASPASLSFGNVAVGSASTQTVAVSDSGTGTVHLSQATLTGAGFSVVGGNPSASIAVGQSVNVRVQFAPQSAGDVMGSLSVVSDASNSPFTIPVSGTGTQPKLSLSPTSVNFGSVSVGGINTLSVKLTNSGNASLIVNQAVASGSGFGISGLSLPLTLSSGQSLTFSVRFAPTATGGATGSVDFTSNAPGSPQMLALSGNGVPDGAVLNASPPSVNFGTVVVGNTGQQAITLKNTGTAGLMISQASTSGAGFSASGLTFPVTLSAGQSAALTAQFAPTAAGSSSGSITLTSNASDSALTISLTGAGAQPQPQLTINPGSVNFGNVPVGSNSTQNVSLMNSGAGTLNVTQVSPSGSGFNVSGLNLPISLGAGQSSSFVAEFTPTSAGNDSGKISVTSNAPGSPATVALTGSGVQGQLTANPSTVNFSSVLVGSSSSQAITLTNGGSASVMISQATPSGTGFSLSSLSLPLTLGAGQSTSFTASFSPTSTGNASGSISIASNAPNSPLTISLSGSGVQPLLSVSPSAASFGNVVTRSNSSQSIRLSNNGSASLTISQANVSGAGFSLSGLSVPLTMATGKSVTFTAVFAPTSAGSVTGSISLISNAPNSPTSIGLSGTGVAATLLLGASPSSLSFSNVTVGHSSVQGVTLTNSGNSNVTIANVSVTGAGFSTSGMSSGQTLSPGQSGTLSVTFAPTVAGSVTGSATVSSNATNSPATISLSGSAVQPASHSVDLSWDTSTSVVVGYNVYRGTQSGGPYTKLNSSQVSSTQFTDSSVQAGQTYFYVVTAVDSNNVESTDSNQISATIPTP